MNHDTSPTQGFYVSKSEFLELKRALSERTNEVERLQTLPESRHKAFLDLLERAEKAEAEVKEIRSALGDDGRRTHKELIELATKASGWREWKQKYIDLRNDHIAEGQDPAGTIWEHADKLQKELKETKADVERLRDALDTLTLVVGLTPIAGNKEALQEAFDFARKALNPTSK
jgi:chromosome segregation ATPase